MELLDTLKKFKNIQPGKDYAATSRRLILAAPRQEKFSAWRLLLRNVELVATFALAGILIMLMIGGLGPWKSIAPLQISNLDPASLKAEADAIDIQIQLTNLNYGEGAVGAQKSAESTISTAPSAPSGGAPKTQGAAAESTANGATSTAVSVDEALLELSK